MFVLPSLRSLFSAVPIGSECPQEELEPQRFRGRREEDGEERRGDVKLDDLSLLPLCGLFSSAVPINPGGECKDLNRRDPEAAEAERERRETFRDKYV